MIGQLETDVLKQALDGTVAGLLLQVLSGGFLGWQLGRANNWKQLRPAALTCLAVLVGALLVKWFGGYKETGMHTLIFTVVITCLGFVFYCKAERLEREASKVKGS